MASNYDRSYTLTIESAIEVEDLEGKRLQDEFPLVIIDGDLSAFDIKRTVITDLHIEADIIGSGLTGSDDPTSSEIRIFNLSRETREAISHTNAKVILEAGYKDRQYLVFSGQVINAFTMKNGQDVVTSLLCKDGWTPNTGVRFSKSYARGESYLTIFNDIISAYNKNGVAKSSTGIVLSEIVTPIKESPDRAVLQRSWSFSGYLKDALKKVCDEFIYTSQIINSRLYIYPKNWQPMFEQIKLDRTNILSIRRRQEGNNNTPNEAGRLAGLEIQILLDGRVREITAVQIDATGSENFTFPLKDYEGIYKVINVRHSLSYEGNSWYTMIECEGTSK